MRKNPTRWLLALLLAVPTLAQQRDRSVALRPLPPLAPPSLQFGRIGFTSALPGDSSADIPRAADRSDQPQTAAWIVELLAQRHAARVRDGQLELQTLAGQEPRGDQPAAEAVLAMRGAKGAVDECARDYDAVAAVVARPIEVMAFRLPLPEGPLPAAVWHPDQVRQRLEGETPLWTARAQTRSGGGVRLADEHWIGHLRDYDVEVAEKSRISDPKVDLAFAGLRLGLTVHELPDDELLLDGEWLLSEPTAMVETGTGEGQPTIDLPDHRTAFVGFGGRVKSGGALAVSGRGGSVGPQGFLLVVRARYGAPRPADLAPDLLVRPVTALTHPAANSGCTPGPLWAPGEDGSGFAAGQIPDFGSLRERDVAALLTQDDGACTVAGGVLFAAGTAETCRAIDAALQALLRDQLRTAELRCEVRSADGTAAALQLAQPVRLGRATAAFVGREQATIADFEVEIANRAQMTNPVVVGFRSGLWVRGRVRPRGLQLCPEVTWTIAAQGPQRSRDHASEPPARLQLGQLRMAVFPWDAPMVAGQEHELGIGPAWNAGGPSTRMFVRIDQN